MLRVNQIKCKPNYGKDDILRKISEILHIPSNEIISYKLVRQSIDARKKPDVYYSYSMDVQVKDEAKILKRFKGKENMVSQSDTVEYTFKVSGTKKQKYPFVIVGAGPAGLFCAYYLSQSGYRVLLIERGKCVDERQKDVTQFWNTGVLNTKSNVQFGEGGAGTFSDGKLNTVVKDKDGRNGAVLKTFVKFGAKENICYDAKPHIGTDVLMTVVRNMRNEIIRNGGEVRFETKLTDLIVENGNIKGIYVNDNEIIECEQVVLAIGHSARDTFEMLYKKDIKMEAKAFAVGLRVEHPQNMINLSQYGKEDAGELGAAPYKVTAKAENGRAVYSFCMCPGGFVVNASSEEGRTAINGMSYSKRDGKNANSAIIVSVDPSDYGSDSPLAGIYFQRRLEEKAFAIGEGKIPVQRYGDFKRSVMGKGINSDIGAVNAEVTFEPQNKGGYKWCDVTKVLPKECNEAFVDGMEAFGRQIKGFNSDTAILSAVESRTSSPVRIQRDETLQAEIKGLYPCGEGAGYAGGITSAAMDGIRVAESLAKEYCPRN